MEVYHQQPMRITKKQSNNEGDGDLKILPGLKGRFTWEFAAKNGITSSNSGFKQQAQGS